MSFASLTLVAACALLALALAAFWPTYLGKPLAAADAYTHAHALLGAGWMVLLALQAGLMTVGQRHRHRVLGRLSFAIAPLFVVSSLLLAHHRFSRMPADTFEQEAYTLYLPLTAALLFALAYALAMQHRRDVDLHARFMAGTALTLVDPVVGRTLAFHVVELPAFWHYQLITFSIEGMLLLAMHRSLPSGSAARRRFGRFALGYALVLLLWFALPHTAAWMAFARLFRAWPLT